MDFFDLLVRYETGLWNTLDDRLIREGQVSLATLHALRLLDRHEGRGRVQDLAGALRITVGATSKLVDRLEREKLVARRPHPEDRRSSLVALTEPGEKALAKGAPVRSETLGELVGDRDARAGTTLLTRLENRLSGAGSAV